MTNKFSIVIPIYNESENITALITQINNSLYKKYIYEIIIVDDCSDDDLKNVLKSKLFSNCVLVSHKINAGQSESIRTGINISKHNVIITLDGDLQNDPADIPKLIEIYNDLNLNLKLVGGIRKKRKDTIIKKFSSYIANSIRKLILNDDCNDTGCGLKIFDKAIFLKFPFFNGIHRFLPALYKGYGYNTFFIEVNHRHRQFGISKYGTFNRLFWGIKDMIKVKKILFNRK